MEGLVWFALVGGLALDGCCFGCSAAGALLWRVWFTWVGGLALDDCLVFTCGGWVLDAAGAMVAGLGLDDCIVLTVVAGLWMQQVGIRLHTSESSFPVGFLVLGFLALSYYQVQVLASSIMQPFWQAQAWGHLVFSTRSTISLRCQSAPYQVLVMGAQTLWSILKFD
jgi:hypothetical protein